MSVDIYSVPLLERMKDAFDEMLVYKDLSKNSIVTAFKLPSFMRDCIMFEESPIPLPAIPSVAPAPFPIFSQVIAPCASSFSRVFRPMDLLC